MQHICVDMDQTIHFMRNARPWQTLESRLYGCQWCGLSSLMLWQRLYLRLHFPKLIQVDVFDFFFQVFHETMTMTMTKKSHKTRKSEFKRSKSIAEAPIYGQHDPHTEHAVDSCLKQLRETFRMSRTLILECLEC